MLLAHQQPEHHANHRPERERQRNCHGQSVHGRRPRRTNPASECCRAAISRSRSVICFSAPSAASASNTRLRPRIQAFRLHRRSLLEQASPNPPGGEAQTQLRMREEVPQKSMFSIREICGRGRRQRRRHQRQCARSIKAGHRKLTAHETARYRCFLPDLAGLAGFHRVRPMSDQHRYYHVRFHPSSPAAEENSIALRAPLY